MKRRTLNALPALIAAVVAGAAITAGPVSAGPSNSTIIYSDTFTPVTRFPDGQALQNLRYFVGPGNSPNLLLGDSPNNVDGWINSPDLTIDSKAMSAVSAEVCLRLVSDNPNTESAVGVYLGVQDKDRNFVLGLDPDTGEDYLEIAPSNSLQCLTLAFEKPVKLVNHPHLVVAVVAWPLISNDSIDLDSVAYTLQPTRKGDIAPGELTP
jgi:hypothetical protein